MKNSSFFTLINKKGEMNARLYTEYLNTRLKSLKKDMNIWLI
ncbi:hypothetical protein IGI42_001780 [Enterococcus sp. AZ109]